MGRSPLEAAAWEGGHTQGGDFWRRGACPELPCGGGEGRGPQAPGGEPGGSDAPSCPSRSPPASFPSAVWGLDTQPPLSRTRAERGPPSLILGLPAGPPGSSLYVPTARVNPAAQAAHAFLRARFVSVSPASFLALVPRHLLGFAQGRMAFRGLSSRVFSSRTPGLAGPGRGAGLSSTRPGGLRCRLGPGGRVWGLLWHTAPGRPPGPRLAAFCSLFPELSPFLVLMNGPLTARVFSRASPHEGRPVR